MKKAISIFLCITILFSLCACSIPFGNAVFSIGTEDAVNSFNPMLAETEAERMLSANCFEGLLRFDESGKINLAGATAYTIEKHGLSYVFKLNPNAQWHTDGQAKEILKSANIDAKIAITADDYVYGFEKFKEASSELDSIEKIVATDDFTLEISLNKEDCDFLYKLATLPFYPCNKLFFEVMGTEYGATPETILYNGPYYVEKQEKNQLTLVRNPHYNGNIQIKNKEVCIFTETSENDLADNFKNNTHNLYIADSVGKKIQKATTSSVSFDTVWGIAFNCKSKLGSSKAFRQVLFTTISATDDFSLPSFATQKATLIFPPTYTVNDVSFKNTEYVVTPREYNEKKALATLSALQSKYNISTYNVAFAVPYDLKAFADETISNWEVIFGDKIKVTLTLFNKEDANTIAENGKYDIAILPIETEKNTAYSLLSRLFVSPCYCDIAGITDLVKNLGTIATDNLDAYNKTENYLIENHIFIPLFYTGKSLYINDNYKGVYLADGGNLIYFYGGEEI